MKEPTRAASIWALCVGLLAAPAIWALSTQIGQIVPYAECAGRIRLSILVSCAGVLISLAAAAFSYWRTRQHMPESGRDAMALRFVGRVSALSALIFAFALAMQGAASIVLTGCER